MENRRMMPLTEFGSFDQTVLVQNWAKGNALASLVQSPIQILPRIPEVGKNTALITRLTELTHLADLNRDKLVADDGAACRFLFAQLR